MSEMNFLLSVCKNDKEEMILRTMWELALRAQEATGLKVSDFVLYGGEHKVFIREEIAKGDSSGFVPIISQDYLDKLRSYINRQHLDRWNYLFNYTEERKVYTKRHIMLICKRIGRRAKLPAFRSHFLRHSRARWLFEKGCAPDTVRDFLRHKDVWVTLTIYGNFTKKAHVDHLRSLGKPIWTYG
jgi:integrase